VHQRCWLDIKKDIQSNKKKENVSLTKCLSRETSKNLSCYHSKSVSLTNTKSSNDQLIWMQSRPSKHLYGFHQNCPFLLFLATSCRRAAATICLVQACIGSTQQQPYVRPGRPSLPDQPICAIQPADRTRCPPTGCTRQMSDRQMSDRCQTVSSLNAPWGAAGV